jgi:hypothetical protein
LICVRRFTARIPRLRLHPVFFVNNKTGYQDPPATRLNATIEEPAGGLSRLSVETPKSSALKPPHLSVSLSLVAPSAACTLDTK